MADITRRLGIGQKAIKTLLDIEGIPVESSRRIQQMTQAEKDAVTHKQCSKCLEDWLILEFRKKATCRDGFDSICIKCRAEMDRKRDKVKIAATHRAWRKRNPAKPDTDAEKKRNADSRRLARHLNPERDGKTKKAFYERHRERILDETAEQRRRYYHDNKSRCQETQRQYRKRRRLDPLFVLEQSLIRTIRDYVKYDRKSDFVEKTLGCSIAHARQYIESLFRDGMSWNNHGNQGWHLDHRIPRAAFDLTDPEQQKACFHYTNLIPLWSKDNLSKQDSIEIEGKRYSCRRLKKQYGVKTLVDLSTGEPRLPSSLLQLGQISA